VATGKVEGRHFDYQGRDMNMGVHTRGSKSPNYPRVRWDSRRVTEMPEKETPSSLHCRKGVLRASSFHSVNGAGKNLRPENKQQSRD
jgi:hypothetical protein